MLEEWQEAIIEDLEVAIAKATAADLRCLKEAVLLLGLLLASVLILHLCWLIVP